MRDIDSIEILVATVDSLLFSRQNGTETLKDWIDLARVVGEINDEETVNYLTEKDMKQIKNDPDLLKEWDKEIDGDLGRL